MKICGIELKGSKAILALIEIVQERYLYIDIDPKIISLADDESTNSVKMFYNTIGAYFRDNKVTLVALKKRGKTGQYAGGPVTFKIEGLIQHCAQCEVDLIAGQTVSSTNKKHKFNIPGNLNKYQEQAYLTGCTAYTKHKNV